MNTNEQKTEKKSLGRGNEGILGCMALGTARIGFAEVDEREAVDTIQKAVSLGLSLLDTSPKYGDSERRVGLALRGIDPKEAQISTKVGAEPDGERNYSGEGVRRSVERSLARLGRERLDYCFVHDPFSMDEAMSRGGAFDELWKMKSEGLVGHVGLGVRRHDFHRLAIESGLVDALITYLDYNLLNQSAMQELIPLAKQHGVKVFNGSPLAFGLLAGDAMRPELAAELPDRDLLTEHAYQAWKYVDEKGLRMIDLALQFCLREPLIDCTIIGPSSVHELEENLAAARAPLPPEVWEGLPWLHGKTGAMEALAVERGRGNS